MTRTIYVELELHHGHFPAAVDLPVAEIFRNGPRGQLGQILDGETSQLGLEPLVVGGEKNL